MGSQASFVAPATSPSVAAGTTRKRTAAMVIRISGVPCSLSCAKGPCGLGLLVMLSGVPLGRGGEPVVPPEGTHGGCVGAAGRAWGLGAGAWLGALRDAKLAPSTRVCTTPAVDPRVVATSSRGRRRPAGSTDYWKT